VGGTSTGSTIHVILSDSEESSGWSRFLRFFVACQLLRMTVNGESLNLGRKDLQELNGFASRRCLRHKAQGENKFSFIVFALYRLS